MFNHCFIAFTKKWLYPGMVLLLLLPMLLQAQQYNFRYWSLEQGLPNTHINSITQDNKGYLWLATPEGISLFDGIRFKNYTSHHGLPHNLVKCIFQDSKGRTWIGTQATGLAQYAGLTQPAAFTSVPAADAGSINDITEDKLGQLWLATDSGVYYLHKGSFFRNEKFPLQPYTAIRCTAAGEVLAGSATNGLYLASEDTTMHFTRANGLAGNSINCLKTTQSGSVWIGTSTGVSRYEQGHLTTPALPAELAAQDVAAIAEDGFHHIWIGLRHQGLLRYDGKTVNHITKHNGLKANKIASLSTDSEGNLWIGTAGYGLQQYKNSCFTHFAKLGHLEEPGITALTKDNAGTLWVGTENGQVAYQAENEFHWMKNTPWPEGTSVNYLYRHPNGKLWVCTSKGFWQLGQDGQVYVGTAAGLPAEQVFHCLAASDGTAWLATAGGVARLRQGKVTAIPGPATGKAYYLHQDRQKQLWLGAEKGVFNITGNAVTAAPALAGLPAMHVSSIAEDAMGRLYFGSREHGLFVVDPNRNTTTHYTKQLGLPHTDVRSLYTDNTGNLWLGTGKGILKVNLAFLHQKNKLRYRNYTYHDGFTDLGTGRNTIIQLPDNSIWFGTPTGLTRYHHRLDRRNKIHTKPLLTSMELFMQPTNWQELGYETDAATGLPINPQFLHNQNHITFGFQGICLTVPEKVKYKYKLQGHNDTWSAETNQPFATFANLGPGTYTFELLASNNDGYWSPRPLTYTFSITPPLWRRNWFLGLLFLLLVASVVSLVRLREHNLVKRTSLLEQKVQHRTQLLEEKNKEKETLLKEIHHRVKNNLQIVISLLNMQARHTSSPEAIEVMQAIRNRVRSMAILHERLYQQDNLGQIDLQNYFTQIGESIFSSYGITSEKVALQLAVPPIKVDIDSAITLGLIVNEIITNALKYAFPDNKTGHLSIVLEHQHKQTYKLIIADNGPGLPPAAEHQLLPTFGLQLVDALIRKLNGKIELKNSNGTIVILNFILPL